MSQAREVHIIGGGFSGLTQAFYMQEQGFKVHIHEKNLQAGGVLGTTIEHDYLVEHGANAFIANKELERIASQIGVTLLPKKNAARKRFIYREGQKQRWPLSFKESFPLSVFLLKKAIGAGKTKSFNHQESLRDWGCHHIGVTATEYLLEPAMQGVYAARSSELNAELVLRSINKRYPKGKLRGSVAPQFGMQEWIDKLTSFLKSKGCEFHFEDEVQDSSSMKNVIFAVGLEHLKSLFNLQKLQLPESILKTRSASLTSITVIYKEVTEPEGFGCLFPRSEGFNSLGVLFNHNIFEGRTPAEQSETWILNDDVMDFSSMSHSALLRYVLSDRFEMVGSYKEPDYYRVSQWPERIPLYDHHLAEFNKDLKTYSTPHLFVGNYLGDLGLSKILYRAKENASRAAGGHFG